MERLLLIHSHVRPHDDSEYVDLFPMMNRQLRGVYEQSSFQNSPSQILQPLQSLPPFPITTGIPNRIRPTLFQRPSRRSFGDRVAQGVALAHSLVQDSNPILINCISDAMGSTFALSLPEHPLGVSSDILDQYNHAILLVDAGSEASDFSFKGKISVVSSDLVQHSFTPDLEIIQDYLISILQLESSELVDITPEELDRYYYQIL